MPALPSHGVAPFVSDPVPGDTLREDFSWLNRTLLAFLAVIAFWSFLWPAYRAFLNIEIDVNEGWNAYLADAAIHGNMALYPARDSLVTNNYPPLSFYLVGAAGQWIGDPLLAGRLLSLAAVLGIGIAIALCVRRLGGTPLGATAGGLLFVATMSRFFIRYVGMDDPQLLAQAVMAFAFAGFLSAWNRDRGYLVPILFMVLAGFIKHNIVALPAAAFLWLAVHRPRQALQSYSIAFLAIALGFVACSLLYGKDFMFNMLTPRTSSGIPFRIALAPLARIDAALIACLALVCFRPRDSQTRLISLVVLIGIAVYFVQKRCTGVDINAIFDLLIGVSIGTGLAISVAPPLPPLAARFVGANALASVILLAIGLRLLPTRNVGQLKAVRLFFDPSLKTEIALREKAMAETVARVRATSGPVLCTTFVCYRSGKPFAVDRFNVEQRIAAGALPRDVLKSRIRSGALTDVFPDPLADWDKGSEQVSPEHDSRKSDVH